MWRLQKRLYGDYYGGYLTTSLAGDTLLWLNDHGRWMIVGLLLAVESRDLDAVDLWTDRILGEGWADPWSDKLMIAQMISTLPERRDRALELARAALSDLDAVDLAGYPGRPLGQTASEYADVLAGVRAEAQAEYNRLLAVG